MRITKLYIKEYKNIKDFEWQLNPNYPIAVIVGKNASGKTNLLTAIAGIFQYILLYKSNSKNKPEFEFEITYQYGDNNQDTINIIAGKDIEITKNNEQIRLYNDSAIKQVLPENIFLYYAGISKGFATYTKQYDKNFKNNLNNDEKPQTRSIISYEYIHYKCVMSALLLSSLSQVKEFLYKNFSIIDLEKIEIQFSPKKNMPYHIEKIIRELFFHAKSGMKCEFDETTPIESLVFNKENITNESIRNFGYESGLFQKLDLLYLFGFLKDIKIYFKKENVNQPIEFEELSEGEKQRLAIYGAIEVFRGKETLFLLDEPDAFAHPRWQWDFVPDMQKSIGERTFSQAIFVTHSPAVLSTVKDNVFVMENGNIHEVKNTYGMDINSTLIDVQDSPKRTEQVENDFNPYFNLIESGKGESEEAKNLRKALEKDYSLNHPSFAKADMLIALYQ